MILQKNRGKHRGNSACSEQCPRLRYAADGPGCAKVALPFVMCHDGTGLQGERAEARFWGVRTENGPPQTAQEPRSGSTRIKATLENQPICAVIAVPLLEPGRRATTRAAQGRKAAPAGGPIGTKSGGSITPKSGGPIQTKSGGSNHPKSCTNAANRHSSSDQSNVRVG